MAKKMVIALAILLLASALGTLSVPGKAPNQFVVVLNTFSDSSTEVPMVFEAPGNNTTLSIKIPKRVTVWGASMTIAAQPTFWNETFNHTTQEDFLKFNPVYQLDLNSSPDNVTLQKPYDDNFNDYSLDAKWKWKNPAPSYDEGSSAPGELRMTAGTNTNFLGGQANGSLLYQNISSYYWTGMLKVNATPAFDGQRAGFMVYYNDSWWSDISYAMWNGTTRLVRVNNNNGSISQVNLTLAANPVYLKIDRGWTSGPTFFFNYSLDGITYTRFDAARATWSGTFASYVWAGPVIMDGNSGQPFYADFDDFSTNRWSGSGYMVSPKLAVAGMVQSCELQWDATLVGSNSNVTIGARVDPNAFSWDSLTKNARFNFSVPGKVFQYNVTVTGTYMQDNTPTLREVRGNLTVKDQPVNCSLDFGNRGLADWNYAPPFTAPQKIFFRDALIREIENATADGENNVVIPLRVRSDGKGIVTLANLSIEYIVNSPPSQPVVQSPANGTWVTTTKPSLRFSATDPDGGELNYTIEIYYDSLPPAFYTRLNQANAGWSSKSYSSGDVANYTFPWDSGLLDGEHYLWRVRANDSWTWSQWSEMSAFAIDTTPPEGWVLDDGAETTNGTSLHCNIALKDLESGIVKYEVWLGTAPNASDLMAPTIMTDPNVVVTGLDLIYGPKYYFTARALNGAGLWSTPVSSDGISVKKGAVNHVPWVNMTNPAEGDNVTGGIRLSGNAGDTDRWDTLTVMVQIDNGEWKETEGNYSWNFSWDSMRAANGAHKISAKAWDGRINSPIVTVNITVNNKHDIEIVSAWPAESPKMSENSTLQFSVEAQDPLGRPLSYRWRVDGAQQGVSTREFNYTTTFDSSGSHTITVSAFAGPDQANFTWNVTVSEVNRGPSAVIASPAAGANLTTDGAVEFNALGSSDPDREDVLNYTWDFGDGTEKGYGLTVKHTYQNAGKYIVTLTVSDPDNAYDIESIEVEVQGKAAEAGAFWSSTGGMLLIGLLIIVLVAAVAGATMFRRKRPAWEPEKEVGRVKAPARPTAESELAASRPSYGEEEPAYREGLPGEEAQPLYEVGAEPAPGYDGAPAYEAVPEAPAEAVYEAPARPVEAPSAPAWAQRAEPSAYAEEVAPAPAWAAPPRPAAPARRPAYAAPAEPAYSKPAPTPAEGAPDEMSRLLAILEGRPAAPQPPARPPRREEAPAWTPMPEPAAPAWATAPAPAAPAWSPEPQREGMDDIFAKLKTIGEEFETGPPAAPPPRPPAPGYGVTAESATMPAEEAAPQAPPPAPAPYRPAPAYAPTKIPIVPAGKKKLLRCPKCQIIFEVMDTGERPLAIKCTACGATGSLKK